MDLHCSIHGCPRARTCRWRTRNVAVTVRKRRRSHVYPGLREPGQVRVAGERERRHSDDLQSNSEPLMPLRPLLAIGALVSVCGCGRPGESAFWEVNRSYLVELHATRRWPLPLEWQDFRPLSDSLRIVIRLDSMTRDSLFGSYDGNLRILGVRAGTSADTSRRVIGRIAGDSVHLTVEPAVRHGELWLTGVLVGEELRGQWVTNASPRIEGRFEIRSR